MQFIDTHIHLQDFKADFAPRVLESAAALRLVLVSAKEVDFAKVAALAEEYPVKAVPAFGVHPWYADEGADVEVLRAALKRFPQALVGEIGVDGIRKAPDEAQHRLFEEQLKIAKEFNRPVIIHAARAFDALLKHEAALKEVRFSYHGFVKNRELIKFINKCGGYFGLGAHFLKQEKASEMFADMPQDKVLFETDAPYQVSDEGYLEAVEENLQHLQEIAQLPEGSLREMFIQNAEDFIRC